jgi:hypothetical protein
MAFPRLGRQGSKALTKDAVILGMIFADEACAVGFLRCAECRWGFASGDDVAGAAREAEDETAADEAVRSELRGRYSR